MDLRAANVFLSGAPSLQVADLHLNERRAPAVLRQTVENFLLDNKIVLKLGDFGHTCSVQRTTRFDQFNEGDARYCAQELINGSIDSIDPTLADMFSLGATVYELCLGRPLKFGTEEGSSEWHNIRYVICRRCSHVTMSDISTRSPDPSSL